MSDEFYCFSLLLVQHWWENKDAMTLMELSVYIEGLATENNA